MKPVDRIFKISGNAENTEGPLNPRKVEGFEETPHRAKAEIEKCGRENAENYQDAAEWF